MAFTMRFDLFRFALLALLVARSWAMVFGGNVTGLDPILNFCSRWQHASVVKNGVLYIDGGIQTFRTNGGNYTNGTNVPDFIGVNEWVLTVDMDKTWIWQVNITEGKLSKMIDPSTEITPFNGTIRGALWQGPVKDDNTIYTFGGTSFMQNKSFDGWAQIQSSANPLWSYNTETQASTPYLASVDVPVNPNYGASAEAVDQGLGFYLNGQVDSGTRYDVAWLGNNSYTLPGMVVVDLYNQTMVNISTPGLDDTYPRVGGQLAYVLPAGKRGVLVSLGGAYTNSSAPSQLINSKLATFDEVAVFDIASFYDDPSSNGTWYTQKTSGTIPPPRIDTCTVTISASDNSSHQIYMYGGRDPTTSNDTLYDDIYVLTLPSFTWVKLYQGQSPRWGHTCHVVGNRQMLTVSGSLNKSTEYCDWEYRGVAIFDLSAALWGMTFIDPDPEYNVTQLVLNQIKGNGRGGATVTAPANGWDNKALSNVMYATRTPIHDVSLPSDQPSSGSSKTKPGTIAGAVVGGVVGLAIIIAIAVMYFRLRRMRLSRAPKTDLVEPDGKEKMELEGDGKAPVEVGAKDMAWEMEAGHGQSEASPVTSTAGRAELPGDEGIPEGETERAELSGENVPPGGRLGVPRIETTTVDDNKPDDWVGEKKEPGVESPAQERVRPSSRDFPSWEEVKDLKNKDGSAAT